MFNFGRRGVWGLDIGESALKAIKMAKTSAGLVIEDFEVIPYSKLDVPGPRKREDLVFQALMRFFAQPERQGERFFASIPSQNVFSRFIGLPPVDRRRIAEIVRYEARQQIPFDLSEVVWDYQLVRPDFLPGEEIEIGLFAVKREVINAFLAQFVMAQDWLDGVQIAPLAAYNYLRADQQIEKPTVVIDIGAQSTDLIIVEGTKFWLRNLPIAGNSFNAILAKKFGISEEEAEKLKRGLARSKHRKQVFEVLRPVLKDLVAEVQRSIGYYKSLAREVKFDQVLLLGEGHNLFGLQRFLSDQLQYRVQPLQETKGLNAEIEEDRKEEFQRHLPGMAVAMGLAVQGLGAADAAVDLLPEEFTLRRELKRKRVPAAVAVGLLWVAMLMLFMGHRLAVAGVETFRFEREVTDEEGRRVREVVEEHDIQRVISQAQDLAGRYRDARGEINTDMLEKFQPLGRARDFWAQAVAGLTEAVPTNPPIYLDQLALQAAGPEGRERGRFDDLYDDDDDDMFDRGRRPGTQTPAGKAFQFNASMDQRYREDMLIREFPRMLEEATIYPEQVKLFSRVEVGPARFQTVQADGPTGFRGYEDDMDDDYMDDDWDEPDRRSPRGRRDAGRTRNGERREERVELVVPVTAVLRSREEIAADVEKVRQEREAERERELNP